MTAPQVPPLNCGGLGPMQIQGSTVLTPRPPANSPRGEHADVVSMLQRLEDVRCRPRLPLICVICSCHSVKHQVSEDKAQLYDSDIDSDSDSEDSDSEMHDVKLCHVMKAFALYEKRPVDARNPSTLCTLVLGYTCMEDIEDEHTEKIMALIRHSDQGLVEGTLLLIGQLSGREDNAFKFVLHDAIDILVELVNSDMSPALLSAAASALTKLCQHRCLEDMWADNMINTGLSVLLGRLAPHQVPSVRQSIGEVMAALAKYHNLAMLILDHGMEAITPLKVLNSDCKEVYMSIVTAIVLHTDHTCAEILDAEVLPSVLNMLKQGPCGPQARGLRFLSALCQNEIGLVALLELKVVPLLMSALMDSECRMVRCGAAECLSHLVAISRTSFQKQAFVQVDGFYHDHEMALGFDGKQQLSDSDKAKAPFRANTTTRVHRALQDVVSTVVAMLRKEARMEKDHFGKTTHMSLCPTIDVDPIALSTMKHLVMMLGNMTRLKVNRPRIKNCNPAEMEEREWKEAWRNLSGKANPQMLLLLLDGGAICVLDLLHAYTLQLHVELDTFLPLPPDVSVGGQPVRQILKAWSQEVDGHVTSATRDRKIFNKNEMDLVLALIQVIDMFAKATHKHDIEDKEKYLKQKVEEYRFREINNNTSQNSSESDDQNNSPKKKKNGKKKNHKIEEKHSVRKCACCNPGGSHAQAGVGTFTGVQYQEELEKTLGVLWRLLRIDLYEGGILESVGPWLQWKDVAVQCAALSVLSSMIQPVPETALLTQPATRYRRPPKYKPAPEMTPQEKKYTMRRAIHQMSAESSDVVQKALGLKLSARDTNVLDTSSASYNIRDYIDQLDKSGVLNDKQYKELVTGMLAQEKAIRNKNVNFKTEQVHSGENALFMQPNVGQTRSIYRPRERSYSAHQLSQNDGTLLPSKAPAEVHKSSSEQNLNHPQKSSSEQHLNQWKKSSSEQSLNHSFKSKRPCSGRLISSSHTSNHNKNIGIRPVSCKPIIEKPVPARTWSSKTHNGDVLNHRPMSHHPQSGKVQNDHRIPKRPQSERSTNVKAGNMVKSPRPSYDKPQRLVQSGSGMTPRFNPGSAKFRSASARPKSACDQLVRYLEQLGPLPWRPTLRLDMHVMVQCQARLVEVCGHDLLKALFSKDVHVSLQGALVVEQITHLTEAKVLMKFSEHGLMPCLVDFLRVWDKHQLLLLLGLDLAGQLVSADVRLCELFGHHGGTALLMSLASSQSGLIKREVAATLKQVTKASRASGTGQKCFAKKDGEPDIWDKILLRWREEDRVMLMLRKKFDP